ncbi:hypothetical protein BD770DRAFT_473461 [Pilaira anomala]|nr:hypothetical protein BD770DRAFT_473461 [Pilaira anomala]
MSTRHARVADKELNDKHTRILVELLKQPENKVCADCKKKDPRWASWNLGIFICIRCSGLHRSLGTHISKVKSVDLDTWTVEQIENMVKWGNQKANAYWESKLESNRRPNDNDMDAWIRAKYERKVWIEDGTLPNPTNIIVNTIQNKDPAPIKEKIVDAPVIKDISREFGLLYHASVTHTKKETPQNDQKTIPAITTTTTTTTTTTESYSPVKASANNEYKKPASPNISTTSSGFRMDMSSFQEQLSGLSLGRPASGIIPQAPPGSNTSWTNFLVNQQTKSSSSSSSSDLGTQSLDCIK